MNIGFIGLGNMGAPMAENLAKAGLKVVGFDTVGVTAKDVEMAKSAAKAAKQAEIVITMLPNGDILRSVANEIIPEMAKGTVFLDCSTVDVQTARDVADMASAEGILPLDAPVSGGIGGASTVTVEFRVGASGGGLKKERSVL